MAGIINEQDQGEFAIPTTMFDPRQGESIGSSAESDRVEQITRSTLLEVPTLGLNRSASKRSSPQNVPDSRPTDRESTKKARNAANCRHGKTSGSKRSNEQLCERNRKAAAKHRMKRRAITEGMSDDLQDMRSTNKILKQECLALRNQLSYWRMHALQHISGEGGCQCNTIHQYNANQACEIVLGVERGEKESPGLQMDENIIRATSNQCTIFSLNGHIDCYFLQ